MKRINCKNLIAKEVIAIDNGQNLGYVLSVCYDEGLKNFLGLVIADEESERENFLPKENIKNIGDCIFIDSAYNLVLNFSDQTNSPIGKRVFSDKCEYLGQVKDVVLENNKPSLLATDRCELPISLIYNNGIDVVFFGKKAKKNMIKHEKFNFSSYQINNKVEIQGLNLSEENTNSKFKIQENNKKIISSPAKVTLAPSGLLNKTASCDIFGLNNEIVVKEGQIITSAKIDKAKKHGVINLLILNSK